MAEEPTVPARLLELQGFVRSALKRQTPIQASSEVDRWVAGSMAVPSDKQLEIYRRQVWLRFRDCLAEDYPGLRHLLGTEAFDSYCRSYLEAHPSTHHSLRDLGHAMPDFAAGYPPFHDLPVPRDALIEMVRFEHAFVDIFDGPALAPLPADKVLAVPADGWSVARLVLHPQLFRMALTHNVHDIRRAAKRDEAPPELVERHTHVALFRPDLQVRCEELAPIAFALLDELSAGTPLVPACQKVLEAADAHGDRAGAERLSAESAAWFKKWSSWGWIVDVEYPPGDDDPRV